MAGGGGSIMCFGLGRCSRCAAGSYLLLDAWSILSVCAITAQLWAHNPRADGKYLAVVSITTLDTRHAVSWPCPPSRSKVRSSDIHVKGASPSEGVCTCRSVPTCTCQSTYCMTDSVVKSEFADGQRYLFDPLIRQLSVTLITRRLLLVRASKT